MLVVGRKAVDEALARIDRGGTAAPGRVLSLVILIALLSASATNAFGLHAVFGGFVAGLVVVAALLWREWSRLTFALATVDTRSV